MPYNVVLRNVFLVCGLQEPLSVAKGNGSDLHSRPQVTDHFQYQRTQFSFRPTRAMTVVPMLQIIRLPARILASGQDMEEVD